MLEEKLSISAKKNEALLSDNAKAREDTSAAKNRILCLEKSVEECEIEVRHLRLSLSNIEQQSEQTKLLCGRQKKAVKIAHAATTKKAGKVLRVLATLKHQHSRLVWEFQEQLNCTYAFYTTIADKLGSAISSSAE